MSDSVFFRGVWSVLHPESDPKRLEFELFQEWSISRSSLSRARGAKQGTRTALGARVRQLAKPSEQNLADFAQLAIRCAFRRNRSLELTRSLEVLCSRRIAR